MQTPSGVCIWELSFSLVDSKFGSKQVLYDSSPLLIHPNVTRYTWPSLSIAIPELSILDRNAFTVMINLHPIDKTNGNRGRILWFPCIVQYTSMIYYNSTNNKQTSDSFEMTYDYNPNTVLTMSYSGSLLYNGDYERTACFTLKELTVAVSTFIELEEVIAKQANQALVAVSEIVWRDQASGKMIKSPISYLNRACEVRSTDGKDRLYIWHLNDAGAAFHGLKRKSDRDWQNQMHEHDDLVKLRLIAPLSIRRQIQGENKQQQHRGLPDHEAMQKKQSTCAPIAVCPGQTVVLKFFNLFNVNDPSRSCEVHIKWNDYIGHPQQQLTSTSLLKKSAFKRFSLNGLYKKAKEEKQHLFRSSFTVYPGFIVEIDYNHAARGDKMEIFIVTIYVHVQNYHFTLAQLGHYGELTTA